MINTRTDSWVIDETNGRKKIFFFFILTKTIRNQILGNFCHSMWFMTFSLYFFLYLFKLLLIFLLVFHILKISVKYVPNVHERNLRFHQNTLPCFLHTLTEQKVVSICMNVCCKFYGSLKICGCWFCVKTIATNGNKYTNIFECH